MTPEGGFAGDAASANPAPVVLVIVAVIALAIIAAFVVVAAVTMFDLVTGRRRGRRDGVAVYRCRRCGTISAHPHDVAEGYCGRCHDWTR